MLILCSYLLIGWTSSSKRVRRPAAPVINDQARVKQPRIGRDGDLLDVRKVILQWGSVPNAVEYEVCHNCQMDSQTGPPKEGVGGKTTIERPFVTRGGNPAHIVRECPIGINTFHVRVRVGDMWSDWSEQRRYDVHEDTTKRYADHQEL